MSRKTTIINMFAGPGAGKTTCAWEIASELKKKGFVTEYVPEYAKELVWDKNYEMLDGSLEHQRQLLAVQTHRIVRLIGQVDFVVTDAPLMLNSIYFTSGTPEEQRLYRDEVFEKFSSFENFSVFIRRGNNFEQAGRIHDLSQSMQVDQQIKEMLDHYQICYGVYDYSTIRLVTEDCLAYYHQEIQQKEEKMTIGSESPWGEVQHYSVLCPGVFQVSTASHGGVMALNSVVKEIFSDEARSCGMPWSRYLCYEEDCAATVAILELLDQNRMKEPVNEYYGPGEYRRAIESGVQHYYPEYWQSREEKEHGLQLEIHDPEALLRSKLKSSMDEWMAIMEGMTPSELIDKSKDITAMRDAYDFLMNCHGFEPEEVEALLSLPDPLETVAEKWYQRMESLNDFDVDLCQLSQEARTNSERER